MFILKAITLGVALLAAVPVAYGESGAEGWLRYAPLPAQAANQYASLPRYVIGLTHTAVAHSAANELTRGLHAMLRDAFLFASGASLPLPADAVVIGTPDEIRGILPSWHEHGKTA